LASDKFYEANLTLKQVQDGVRYASTALDFTANKHGLQPAGSFTETVTPSS
jgi:hypothetical protein